jgi:hypothetical protein
VWLQPESFNWSGKDIDFLFDDGAHTNPALRMNLDYWLPFVKENGIVAIHDCRPWLPKEASLKCQDVEDETARLINNGYEKISQTQSLAVLKKLSKNSI